MDSIRIKNLRSIVDSGYIKLSRINILLGRNSSGKSSFLRLFPLLKETSRHELRGPILWFDENYDFGDFVNTLSRHAEGDKDMISMEFTWTLSMRSRRSPYSPYPYMIDRKITNSNEKITAEIGISKYGDNTFFKRIKICIWNYEILLENDNPSKYVELTINGRKITSGEYKWNYGSPGIIPELRQSSDVPPYERIMQNLNELFGKDNVIEDNYFMFSRSYALDSDSVWKFIHSNIIKHKSARLTDKVKKTTEFRTIVDSVIWMSLDRIIEYVDDELSRYFSHTYYVTPLRYNFLRYMRNRDLAVEYVESTGKNVMEYILSLNEKERESYTEYVRDTLGILIDVEGHENKSIYVTMSDGERDNIVDVGYGYSQVLPIATILWDRAYKKEARNSENTVVIEQPEVHLHPAMQKKLARLFVAALDLAKKREHKLTLIIETHSNSLVNRLGRYVQNGNSPVIPELFEYYQIDDEKDVQISNDDISIYLFEKQQGITKITRTHYDESGRIEQWPIGFLD